MTDEHRKSYRGVLCSSCKEPIRVSARVIQVENEIAHDATNVPYSFAVRCKACEHEGVYTMDDVRTFEGEPRARRVRACSAGAN